MCVCVCVSVCVCVVRERDREKREKVHEKTERGSTSLFYYMKVKVTPTCASI